MIRMTIQRWMLLVVFAAGGSRVWRYVEQVPARKLEFRRLASVHSMYAEAHLNRRVGLHGWCGMYRPWELQVLKDVKGKESKRLGEYYLAMHGKYIWALNHAWLPVLPERSPPE